MGSVTGLTSAEVKERVSAGQVNSSRQKESKSYTEILIGNVCTKFNLLLFIIGAAFIVLGVMQNDPHQFLNALSATGIIIFNIMIATLQEFKAKRRLDKISLLLRPKVTVIRDGEEEEIDQSRIVRDDIVLLRSGDQALVDGELVCEKYLEMDESLLTGESKTVRKKEGERIFSGSFCIAGEGMYRVDAFGADSYASQMLMSAKKQTDKKTPLQIETNAITMMMMGLALVYIVLTIFGSMFLHREISVVLENIAVILDIVPIALFLLIVVTYMISAIRMADSGVLLQLSSAVESISHIDTICMDKTGTITTNKLKFTEAQPLSDTDVAESISAYIGAIGGKNRTIDALEEHYGAVQSEAIQEIRFTSERKFSAARINDNGQIRTLFLGAGSVLSKGFDDPQDISERINACSARGLRTVVFAECDQEVDLLAEDFVLPKLRPIALFAIEDEVRPDCREIIDSFLQNGTELKVISGDDPVTVDALFTIANIPGERKTISGEELEALEGEEKTKAILETNIFGRMKPDQKEDVIDVLKSNHKYVAMVGDGVNDVKSLKKANVGIALESGSGAARGVADMVLVKDNFSALPKAVIEGKKTVSGMRDILKVYISRNITLAILIALTLLFLQDTPFNPIQNVYYAFVSVSASAFFMAIWARPSDNSDLILPSVLRYCIPTAATMALFGVFIFAIGGALFDLGYLDFIPGFAGFDDKAVSSSMLVLFLTLCGILQLLVVVPYFRIFSIDGTKSDDIKPFLLMLFLVFVCIAGYNVPLIAELMKTPMLPLWLQFLMLGLAIVWFVVQHYALKSNRMKRFEKFVLEQYEKSLDRTIAKEHAQSKRQ